MSLDDLWNLVSPLMLRVVLDFCGQALQVSVVGGFTGSRYAHCCGTHEPPLHSWFAPQEVPSWTFVQLVPEQTWHALVGCGAPFA